MYFITSKIHCNHMMLIKNRKQEVFSCNASWLSKVEGKREIHMLQRRRSAGVLLLPWPKTNFDEEWDDKMKIITKDPKSNIFCRVHFHEIIISQLNSS